MDRWTEKENREFLRAGTVAAAALNPYRKAHSKAITAADIFNLPKPPPQKPTKKQLIANADKVFSIVNARALKLARKKKKRGGVPSLLK